MKAKGVNFANFSQINICNTQFSSKVKFIYFEKATKFCEISTVDLSYVVKFMLSKKATKIDEIYTVNLTFCSKCQIDFCGLLGKHEL